MKTEQKIHSEQYGYYGAMFNDIRVTYDWEQYEYVKYFLLLFLLLVPVARL